MYTGTHREDALAVERIVYDERGFDRRPVTVMSEAVAKTEGGKRLWVLATGLHDEEKVAELCRAASVTPLMIEDILHVHGRPKIEAHGDKLFVCLDALELMKGDYGDEISSQRISIIATTECLICFSEAPARSFEPLFERLDHGSGRLRSRGTDYLTWALLDTIVDHYFEVIERFRERIDELEMRIADDIGGFDVRELYDLKRVVDLLRRRARPAREIVSVLQRADSPVIQEETIPFVRDLYDHTVQVIDELENLRDSAIALRDFYSATASNRMNEVMKVLTCFSAIFLPLTFIAGIYGMNLPSLPPEVNHRYSYAVLWMIFLGIAAGMILFFRRKRWW